MHTLANDTATRDGILAALDNLAAAVGENDTLFLFYSGHGSYGTDGNYYLTASDTRLSGDKVAPGSGISQIELLERLRAVEAKRALLIFNACHSGEISPVLGEGDEPFTGANPPVQTTTALLATGEGRVIITASRANQYSFIGDADKGLTLFAQALAEGLRGEGMDIVNRDGFISAFDLYTHLYYTLGEWATRRVSASVRKTYGDKQEPELTVLKGVGPFAVAIYNGATTLGEFSAPEDLDDGLPVQKSDRARSERILQNLLQIQAGRDVTQIGGDQINAEGSQGFVNRPTGPVTQTFGDTIHGDKVGGDKVGGDKIVGDSGITFGSGQTIGDITIGDVAGGGIYKTDINVGDRISTGDISGSGVAIGRGARASVRTGGGSEDLARAFAAIYDRINARAADPEPIKQIVIQQVKSVEEEAAKGEQADTGKIEGAFAVIARMTPDILEVTASTLLSPISGIATVVKKVAAKAREGRQ